MTLSHYALDNTFDQTVIEQPDEGDDAYCMIQDLISNCMHLAQEHGWDAKNMVRRAIEAFDVESADTYIEKMMKSVMSNLTRLAQPTIDKDERKLWQSAYDHYTDAWTILRKGGSTSLETVQASIRDSMIRAAGDLAACEYLLNTNHKEVH